MLVNIINISKQLSLHLILSVPVPHEKYYALIWCCTTSSAIPIKWKNLRPKTFYTKMEHENVWNKVSRTVGLSFFQQKILMKFVHVLLHNIKKVSILDKQKLWNNPLIIITGEVYKILVTRLEKEMILLTYFTTKADKKLRASKIITVLFLQKRKTILWFYIRYIWRIRF